MEPIFKNNLDQIFFEKNGYVKIPLLSHAQADSLVDYFNLTKDLHETVKDLHHTTTDTQNIDLIFKVDEKIKSVFLPELQKILVAFKPLAGTFHIKEPGKGSATGIHQDPTFVDESKYHSANVWVALQDIDESNGNLFFVKGSNNAVQSLRVTPTFPSYYESFRDSLPNIATQVPLKKGEAVIFSNSTIHGATENLSDQVRLAATVLVCSAAADWLIYHKEPQAADNKIAKYHLDMESFATITRMGRPDSKAFKEYVSYEFPQITYDEFLIRTKNGDGNKTYFQRMRDVFRKKNVL